MTQKAINEMRSAAIAVLPTAPEYTEAETMALDLECAAPHSGDPQLLMDAAKMLRDMESTIDGLYYELQYGDER